MKNAKPSRKRQSVGTKSKNSSLPTNLKWVATGFRRLGWAIFVKDNKGNLFAKTSKYKMLKKSSKKEMRDVLSLCQEVIKP